MPLGAAPQWVDRALLLPDGEGARGLAGLLAPGCLRHQWKRLAPSSGLGTCSQWFSVPCFSGAPGERPTEEGPPANHEEGFGLPSAPAPPEGAPALSPVCFAKVVYPPRAWT